MKKQTDLKGKFVAKERIINDETSALKAMKLEFEQVTLKTEEEIKKVLEKL